MCARHAQQRILHKTDCKSTTFSSHTQIFKNLLSLILIFAFLTLHFPENAIRPITLGRKNYIFCGNHKTAGWIVRERDSVHPCPLTLS